MGYIRVFPAIPDKWLNREISFNNLRSTNGVLVSAVRDVDGLVRISLCSEQKTTVNIYNIFTSNSIIISSKSEKDIIKCKDKILKLNIEAGETISIERYSI
ncbi:MAG: hypothetical protein IJA34_10780 [Lachnospiraceae bacterium]|nr:hypothetical protein [Lachnospiraceae bacterium]